MKPPGFDYVAPTSLEEALAVLAEAGDEAKVLAGGQSLIPLMALRLAQPAVLVDVNRLTELDTLEPDEILCSVSFPVLPASTGFAIEEVARRHGDFAMVGASAAVRIDGDAIAEVRLALINVAERPVRAREAERALAGVPVTDDAALAEASDLATRHLKPSADFHASPAYRRKVAGVCVRRALARAASRAMGVS